MKLNKFSRVEHLQEPIYAMFEDEPNLENGVLYIVDDPHYIEYNCPCGCGNVVMIPYWKPNEDKEKDGWALTEKDEMVTLSPSIFSKSWPCKSHYFIRDNCISWC